MTPRYVNNQSRDRQGAGLDKPRSLTVAALIKKSLLWYE
jgi:hypothetical protein